MKKIEIIDASTGSGLQTFVNMVFLFVLSDNF